MTPSEIRAELLGQHAELRALIEETRVALDGVRTGLSTRGELHDRIQHLWTALRAHNEREELALRELIKRVDAWGPARAELMDETHVKEHTELRTALLDTSNSKDVEATSRKVLPILEQLHAHMTREEEVLLAEHLLRDDDVVIDYFGG